MAIQLTVTGGPETGKRRVFSVNTVSIGRGLKNDLVLQDGLVSQYHGELVLRDQGYVYRDLRSRHGTRVKVNHVTVNLHDRGKVQEVTLLDGAELMLGESMVCIEVSQDKPIRTDAIAGDFRETVATPAGMAMLSPDSQPEARRDGGNHGHAGAGHVAATSASSGIDEQLTTRTQDSLEALTKRLSRQDPRLVSIFKLSRNLNITSDLDEILDLIVEATFEAFPAANFFAISVMPQDGSDDFDLMRPLISRERESEQSDKQPLLSQSLLERVAKSRESVLFVRDALGRGLTDSIVNARIMACLAAPLVGQEHLIGVMQADTRGLGGLFGPEDLDLFTVMSSYAAFAIERVRLNASIFRMFEGIVRASVTAIDARDPSTAGHSERVAKFTLDLAHAANRCRTGSLASLSFSDSELIELRYAALLHDFGKIGVRESVLIKAERLQPGKREEVVARFQYIKALRALEIRNRAFAELSESAKAPTVAVETEIAKEVVGASSDLDELLDFIVQHQGRRQIEPSVAKRIREIGKMVYTDLDGNSKPYLYPDELVSLCVLDSTLTPSEWDDMKAHAARSREYLSLIPWSDDLRNVPCIAGWHHEKLDGSGYPDGLTANDITPQVRILTIADIFDALTAADRPYRKAVSLEEAMRTLHGEAHQGLLDRELVSLFEEALFPGALARRDRG